MDCARSQQTQCSAVTSICAFCIFHLFRLFFIFYYFSIFFYFSILTGFFSSGSRKKLLPPESATAFFPHQIEVRWVGVCPNMPDCIPHVFFIVHQSHRHDGTHPRFNEVGTSGQLTAKHFHPKTIICMKVTKIRQIMQKF